MVQQNLSDEIANCSRLERARRLKIFKFEKDAAVMDTLKTINVYSIWKDSYHPAAFDSAADSINGVFFHGLDSSFSRRLPISSIIYVRKGRSILDAENLRQAECRRTNQCTHTLIWA